MHETSNTKKRLEQQSGAYRPLLIGIAICGLWFILAMFSGIPSVLLRVEAGSQLDQSLSHWFKLIGGLLIVFGLLPVLLHGYYQTYKTYLRATGMLFPIEKNQSIVLIAFILVASIFFVADFTQNGLTGVREYHIANGVLTLELAAFGSLQAAIIEELMFRGIAFSILKRRFPVWVAILLPSILFGFAHVYWGLGRVAVTAFIGMLLAILRWRTDNVWGSMAMHFLINFGFPIPAWVGWLIAVILTAGLEMTKRFSSNQLRPS